MINSIIKRMYHILPKKIRSRIKAYKVRKIMRTQWLNTLQFAEHQLPKRKDAVFNNFERWAGIADGKSGYDFLGTKTSPTYRRGLPASDLGQLKPPLPKINDQYPEWVFLLRFVEGYREKSNPVIVDIGAGWGPWLVRAAAAFKQKQIECKLVGVEADPDHYAFLKEHFIENDLDPSQHYLVEGAVSVNTGVSKFETFGDASGPYGQRLTDDAGAGSHAIPVNTYTLDSILQPFSCVDYMTVDIQGAEATIIPGAIDILTQKVARLQLATHNASIHKATRNTLREAGWRLIWEGPYQERAITRWGCIKFEDGSQTWINPKLCNFF
jgi:FkbM family methyltransferase